MYTLDSGKQGSALTSGSGKEHALLLLHYHLEYPHLLGIERYLLVGNARILPAN